jgi:hypothetical protein
MSESTPAGQGRPTRQPSTRRVATVEVMGPVHWPTLTPVDAEREWPALRAWADQQRERYPQDLDGHVVPNCWYAHESHVMALQALRDYERVAFDPSSSASGAVDWHRAYRDIVAVLRTLTANLRCTATEHFPSRPVPSIDEAAFAQCVAADIARRRREAVERALGDKGTDRASGSGYEA